MGFSLARDVYCGSDPPRKTTSLENYIRKPRKKSKLCKELQDFEEGADAKSSGISPESTKHPTTVNTNGIGIAVSKDEDNSSTALPQESKPAPVQAISLPARPIKQEPSMDFPASSSSLPDNTFLPAIFLEYLAERQNHLSPTAIKEPQHVTNLQVAHETYERAIGNAPQIYKASGTVISIYTNEDGGAWSAGAAIEVIQTPSGFPEQDVWLWEPTNQAITPRLAEGDAVSFLTKWGAEGNHWEVIDVSILRKARLEDDGDGGGEEDFVRMRWI